MNHIFSKYNLIGLVGMIVYPISGFILAELSFKDSLKRLRIVIPDRCCCAVWTGPMQFMKVCCFGDMTAVFRKKIGYVFQDSDNQLFLSTAYEDIAFGPKNYGFSDEEVERRVARALELTGITHLKDRQTYKMSGGEKKLVSIATILSMEPEIILMDEPSIALDPRNRRNCCTMGAY